MSPSPATALTGLPTSAIRGDAAGRRRRASRTESMALTYTDTALCGGNFVGQIFFNRTRDTFGGEIAPIATFQDADASRRPSTLFDQSREPLAQAGRASSATSAPCPASRR